MHLSNDYGVIAVGLACALLGGCKAKSDPNHVVLQDSDLPVQRLHLLNKGDVVDYKLPTGRRLRWKAQSDDVFGSFEQTTACGLKAHLAEPDLDKLQGYGVETSTGDQVSIYRFRVDGYQVERAEDLKAEHCLPVIIRVCPVAKARDMDLREARAFFAEHVATAGSKPRRVPMSTVHHELNEKCPFPVRLVIIGNEIGFHVSGDVFSASEEERRAKLSAMMNHVVDRYEGIDRISKFSISVLKDDDMVFRYEARRDQEGRWALHPR